MIKGFKDFLLRGNVVELAVAVVIGTAFAAIVKAFTDNIINPLLAAIGGGNPGDGLGFRLRSDNPETLVNIGDLIGAIINFVIVAAIVYFVFIAPLNALMERRKRGLEPEVEATPEDIALLQEIRDLLASQGGGTRGVTDVRDPSGSPRPQV